MEEQEELVEMNQEINQESLNRRRNHSTLINGPWIFGLLECRLQENGQYKSGKLRLFIVERRDAQTLLPIIRQNVSPG
ncbi:hypothetical protein HZS_7686 [Henneguya salminicola]|nr:hypothetical protein HZS_7686 [Henneguya salminicola]